MQLTNPKTKTRCELGGCKNRAAYTVLMDRVGIKSRINLCEECASKLYSLLGATMIPKSYDTLKRKRNEETI